MLPLLALRVKRTDESEEREAPTHAPMSGPGLRPFSHYSSLVSPQDRARERSWENSWRTKIKQEYVKEANGYVVTVDVDAKIPTNIDNDCFVEYVKHLMRFCEELALLIDLRQIVKDARLESVSGPVRETMEDLKRNADDIIAIADIASLGNTDDDVSQSYDYGENNNSFRRVDQMLGNGLNNASANFKRILMLPLAYRNLPTWLLKRYMDPRTPKVHNIYVNGSVSTIETMLPEKKVYYEPSVNLNDVNMDTQ
jgi:hypothetical protein